MFSISHSAPLNRVEAPSPSWDHPNYDVVSFLASGVTESGHNTFNALPEDKSVSFEGKNVIQLVEAAQSLYERALRAEDACHTNLIGGLAGGAIIGASLYGLVSYIRRRRNERRNNSD